MDCNYHSSEPALTPGMQAAATLIGELLAQRAKAAAIDSVSWQRKQGQRFHGKVEALLTAMQSSGLPLK